ncbi:MAG: arginine--tRNA ligase [Gammaproteobacteria bacterium]|nr:arginine--tRNA ligase [Gammaproteobacteria bacterium]
MKNLIREQVAVALKQLDLGDADGHLAKRGVRFERTRDARHGDFSANVALVIAKDLGVTPRALAERIASALPGSPSIDRVEVAGAGFLNFYIQPHYWLGIIQHVLAAGDAFGRNSTGAGAKIQVEFVSANPTGPLHIGHGRGAAYGAVIANLLEANGYALQREYYVNDSGRQMDILALSVWLRYLELCGEVVDFPASAYQGAYVIDIARALWREVQAGCQFPISAVYHGLAGLDGDALLDALIARAKSLLGPARYCRVFECGLNSVLAGIRTDLTEFGVRYDQWFSERSLAETQAVERAIAKLRSLGRTYTKDGALWFNAVAFGDEKDRVLVRENGQTTYFASDVAYHTNKFERGFDRVINIWGADHHGYVPRVKAALAALGDDSDRLEVLLVQFATLYRGEERVQMSTRSGEFVTLRELVDEVGRDAARFFYVTRRCEQHLEFDLDLAKSQSADNPAYYIQYAHARIASVFRQLAEQGWAWDRTRGENAAAVLTEAHEQGLIGAISRYPEIIDAAAREREPHQLAQYLQELANAFHGYYSAHMFLVEDESLRNARLNLIAATQQVIRNGLAILGVSAPESM